MPRPPDYRRGSIVNLMASLVEGRGGPPGALPPLAELPPALVARYTSVCLMVVDGLGYHFLRRVRPGGLLRSGLRARLHTVFPSTTAAAITTFLTGEPPAWHGLTGWFMYLRELGAVFTTLPGRPRYGGATLGESGWDMHRLLGRRPVTARMAVDCWQVSPARIAHSDYSRAFRGPARVAEYHDLEGFFATTARLLRRAERPQYVYAYWPELDATAHREGIDSPAALRQLADFDAALGRFLDAVRGTDTLLVICADHGLVDTSADSRLTLDDFPALRDALRLPLCGEPRVAYCYLRPGREAAFRAAVAEGLAGRAELLPAAEMIEAGWFGPGRPHGELANRVGDYVLLMQDRYTLKDWLPQERRYTQVGVHGGASAEEMDVPLIVFTP